MRKSTRILCLSGSIVLFFLVVFQCIRCSSPDASESERIRKEASATASESRSSVQTAPEVSVQEKSASVRTKPEASLQNGEGIPESSGINGSSREKTPEKSAPAVGTVSMAEESSPAEAAVEKSSVVKTDASAAEAVAGTSSVAKTDSSAAGTAAGTSSDVETDSSTTGTAAGTSSAAKTDSSAAGTAAGTSSVAKTDSSAAGTAAGTSSVVETDSSTAGTVMGTPSAAETAASAAETPQTVSRDELMTEYFNSLSAADIRAWFLRGYYAKRAELGLAAVAENAVLNRQCQEHAERCVATGQVMHSSGFGILYDLWEYESIGPISGSCLPEEASDILESSTYEGNAYFFGGESGFIHCADLYTSDTEAIGIGVAKDYANRKFVIVIQGYDYGWN